MRQHGSTSLWCSCHDATPYTYTMNTIQDNPIPYNTIQHNATQYNTIQSNTIQYTILCNTVQYSSIVQYNAIQCNAVQYSHPRLCYRCYPILKLRERCCDKVSLYTGLSYASICIIWWIYNLCWSQSLPLSIEKKHWMLHPHFPQLIDTWGSYCICRYETMKKYYNIPYHLSGLHFLLNTRTWLFFLWL